MTHSTTNTSHLRAVQENKHSVSGLFVFLLIAAYTVFSLMLVLIGVKVYQNVVQTSEENSELRTTIGYLSSRIRASDGLVSVRDEGEFKVMRIGNALDEQDYETRIYFVPTEGEDRGALYEQVIEVYEPFEWDLGELITEVGQFDIEQEGDLIGMKLRTLGGAEHSMHVKLLPGQFATEGGEGA